MSDLYKAHRPDIVLLDIDMPYMDGFQVMKKLNEIESDDYLPVLVLTSMQDMETRLRALESGAKDYLLKPFEKTETLSRIRNMIEVRLLHKEVKKQKAIIENEHKEAEELGKSLLRQAPLDTTMNFCMEVVPSSRASGDRAGFIDEKTAAGQPLRDWLVVLDASGHGMGAAKFQEVALGGLFALLRTGRPMLDALVTVNTMLEQLDSGRYLVGNVWRVLRGQDKSAETESVLIEEINIGQHPVLILEPGENEVKEWEWPYKKGTGNTMPLGMFNAGFENAEAKPRKVKKGTRTVTYTDGITEAVNLKMEQFGISGFKELIVKTKNLSPEQALRAILREVKCRQSELPPDTPEEQINNVHIEDDITLAIIDL